MAVFYIGTSGYSYKDWEGEFYPGDVRANGYLEYYSRFFNTVEINSTYYSLPNSYLFYNILKKTPEKFLLSCKAHSSMTHERNADDVVFKSFLNALDPLMQTDNLGVVLFQFPYSFYFNNLNLRYIEKVKNKFKEIDIACEFRNSSWINNKTLKFLEGLNIGFCNVDEPELPKLLPATNFVTSEIFYLRFHGRNALKWWNCKEAFERYDYMYKKEELEEWLPKIHEASKKVKKVLIYFNNHYKAKAVKSADLLIDLLNLRQEQ
ncbi:DUF72 domain-containing protein [bacterium]|nr:DUF72 domain-containing protein [bacterium]